MFYKPTYCCNCGDKIERIEWTPITSRRFCEVCETEYKFDDWLPRILGGVIVLFGFFGLGSYFQSSEESLEIKTVQKTTNPRNFVKKDSKVSGKAQTSQNANVQQLKPKSNVVAKEKEARTEETLPKDGSLPERFSHSKVEEKFEHQQKTDSEPVYFCGAETKKGTPCSRRVKGGGRCWQHKGRKAILSKKDLFIENK